MCGHDKFEYPGYRRTLDGFGWSSRYLMDGSCGDEATDSGAQLAVTLL
jgi:hypothetical protein